MMLKNSLCFLYGFALLNISSCMLSVPDTENETFACEADQDCAEGYKCRLADNICVKTGDENKPIECEDDEDCSENYYCDPKDHECVKNSQDCRTQACPSGKICVFSTNETTTCAPICVNNEDCDEFSVCLQDIWIFNGTERTQGSACKFCNDCDLNETCQITKDSLYFDSAEIACTEILDDCQTQGCANTDRACVLHSDDSADCVRRCDLNKNCASNNQTCVHVDGFENGEAVSVDVCKDCENCNIDQVCQISSPSNEYDNVLLRCEGGSAGCQNDGDCSDGKVCVRKNSDTNECHPGCRGMADCGDLVQNNCVLVEGPDQDKQICVNCNSTNGGNGCDPGDYEKMPEICTPPDGLSAFDDTLSKMSCSRLPQNCQNNDACPAKMICYQRNENTGEGMCYVPCSNDNSCGKEHIGFCSLAYGIDGSEQNVCAFCNPFCDESLDMCFVSGGPHDLEHILSPNTPQCLPQEGNCTTNDECGSYLCAQHPHTDNGECIQQNCESTACNDDKQEVCTSIFDIYDDARMACVSCPLRCELPGEICQAPSETKYIYDFQIGCECDNQKCSDELGDGAYCEWNNDANRYKCTKSCSSDGQCLNGFCAQEEFTSQGRCVPSCSTDSDCGNAKQVDCIYLLDMASNSRLGCAACTDTCEIYGDLCLATIANPAFIDNNPVECLCDLNQCAQEGGESCQFDANYGRAICVTEGSEFCYADMDCSSRLCARYSNLSEGKCIQDCASTACSGSHTDEVCTGVYDIHGGQRTGCVACQNPCALDNGEICMANTGFNNLDDVSTWCECDDNQCTTDKGITHRCSGNPLACTDDCSTDSACPENAVCDFRANSPLCRIDCDDLPNYCPSPNKCALRELDDDSLVPLCFEDACSYACDDDCVLYDLIDETGSCLDQGTDCGSTQGCADNGDMDTCLWSGQQIHVGHCHKSCTLDSDCAVFADHICLQDGATELDSRQSTGICVVKPLCGGTCTFPGQTCVYADMRYTMELCIPGCQSNQDCLNPPIEACAVDPRYTDNYPNIGFCRDIASYACPGGCTSGKCVNRVTLPSGNTEDVCEPNPGIGDSCYMEACQEGRCVYDTYGNQTCMPTCSHHSPRQCASNETCVTLLGWDPVNIVSNGYHHICIHDSSRYPYQILDTTASWFDAANSSEGVGSAYSLNGLGDPIYTQGVSQGLNSKILMAQLDQPDRMRLYEVFADNGGFCELSNTRGHLGLGEVDMSTKSQVVRALIECDGINSTTFCTYGGGSYPRYLTSVQIDMNSSPCHVGQQFDIRDDSVGYPFGAIGDGYVAVVGEYVLDGTYVRHQIKVAKIENDQGFGQLYWAQEDFYLPDHMEVTEIAVSRDVIAWLATNGIGTWRLYYTPLRSFFQNNPQTRFHDYSESLRDLVVDEHWIAFARDNGSSQDIDFVEVNLASPNNSNLQSLYLANTLASNHAYRAYPGLDDHYLVINDTVTIPNTLWLFELLGNKTSRSFFVVDPPPGQPVVFSKWNGVDVWYYKGNQYLDNVEWFDATKPLFLEDFDMTGLEKLSNQGWVLVKEGGGDIQLLPDTCENTKSGNVLWIQSSGTSDCAKAWSPRIPEVISDMGSSYDTTYRTGKRSYSIAFDICFKNTASFRDFVIAKGHAYNENTSQTGNFMVVHDGTDIGIHGWSGTNTLFTPVANKWYRIEIIAQDNPDPTADTFSVQGYDGASPIGNNLSDNYNGTVYSDGLPDSRDTAGRILFGKYYNCDLTSSHGEIFIDGIVVKRY